MDSQRSGICPCADHTASEMRLQDAPVPAGFRQALEERISEQSIERCVASWPAKGPAGPIEDAAPLRMTEMTLNMDHLQHTTPGLGLFQGRVLETWVRNAHVVEPCLLPPVFWCPVPGGDGIEICVRILVVDECNGSRRKDPGQAPGLLQNVKYANKDAPHLGELSSKTVAAVKAVLARASAVWNSECGIQFKVARYQGEGAYKGKDFIFGLDLQALKDKVSYPVPKSTEVFKYDNVSMYLTMVDILEDFCQFFDTTRKRQVLTWKKDSARRRLVWARSDTGFGAIQGQPVTAAELEELKKNAELYGRKADAKRLEELLGDYLPDGKDITETTKHSVLAFLGDHLDQAHGDHCINVFVVDQIRTSDKDKQHDDVSADLGGYAQTPGRSLFIEDAYVGASSSGLLLAHEFGHNLGLPDEKKETNNLMFSPVSVQNLRQDDQCAPAKAWARQAQYGEQTGEEK